eukprot:CAMPEP_0204335832 /NCGR_PEP_ID=MMETSP0469-20131031/19088_1 /ASSEMBLY_ACC=CAM_ASM_000384 /TAXON_ID=2969 /ORGANISM="Oxyrrhis marina" /LENGTH=87 /DNA_ID=CAMNT_0051319587 /DNA_START=14 /DNA_END=274 /DNA_ORIENTATION=-
MGGRSAAAGMGGGSLVCVPQAMAQTSDAAVLGARLAALDRIRQEKAKTTPAKTFPAHWSDARKAATLARQGVNTSRLQSGTASFVQR